MWNWLKKKILGNDFEKLKQYVEEEKFKYATAFDISTSLNLVQAPIITMNIKGKDGIMRPYNFVFDTGAAYSVIDNSVLEELDYETIDKKSKYYGIDGQIKESYYVALEYDYKNSTFVDAVQPMDFSLAADRLSKETGVKICGLIGNKFMQIHKYAIDFDELIIYRKKNEQKNNNSK